MTADNTIHVTIWDDKGKIVVDEGCKAITASQDQIDRMVRLISNGLTAQEASEVVVARHNIYTVLSGTTENWTVVKMDRDWEVEDTYYISKHVNVCSCFAGSKDTCRHRQMLSIFQVENKVDSREAYDFDKQKWVEKPVAAMDML